MTEADTRRSVLLLMHGQAMSLDSVRHVLKLANNMRAVGYSTSVVNIGPAAPRPTWLVPAFLPVWDPTHLHTVFDRLAPRAIIAADWQTAYLASDEAVRRDSLAFHFVDDLSLSLIDSIITANLVKNSYRNAQVLYHTPGIREPVMCFGAHDPHRLITAIDDACFDAVSDNRSPDVLFFSSVGHENRDDLVIKAYLQTEARTLGAALKCLGYSPPPKRDTATLTYVPLDWRNDNSQQRAHELAHATCFVSVDERDSIGTTILEAMACGCPVIAVKSRGTQDILASGENCILVDSPDAAQISSAIDTVSQDAALRQRLSVAGRKTVAGFRWDRMLESLPEELRVLRDPERAYGLGLPKWNQ